MSSRERSRSESVGILAGTLALAELGLGSLLHALHIPLTGTILSLNQGFFLSRVTRLHAKRTDIKAFVFDISIVTALLKSLSPMGKKLTPMLAIATQGLLFTAGISIFGINILSVVLSSMLLSIWGVFQPIFLAGVMIGTLSTDERQHIIAAWQKLVSGLPWLESQGILNAVLYFVILKCMLAGGLAAVAWYSKNVKMSSWLTKPVLANNQTANFTATRNMDRPTKDLLGVLLYSAHGTRDILLCF